MSVTADTRDFDGRDDLVSRIAIVLFIILLIS